MYSQISNLPSFGLSDGPCFFNEPNSKKEGLELNADHWILKYDHYSDPLLRTLKSQLPTNEVVDMLSETEEYLKRQADFLNARVETLNSIDDTQPTGQNLNPPNRCPNTFPVEASGNQVNRINFKSKEHNMEPIDRCPTPTPIKKQQDQLNSSDAIKPRRLTWSHTIDAET